MDRVHEVQPGDEAFDPAHLGLERLKPVELDPQPLVELWPLDEFDAASVERGVVGPNVIVELSRATERHFGVDGDAFASAPGRNQEWFCHVPGMRPAPYNHA